MFYYIKAMFNVHLLLRLNYFVINFATSLYIFDAYLATESHVLIITKLWNPEVHVNDNYTVHYSCILVKISKAPNKYLHYTVRYSNNFYNDNDKIKRIDNNKAFYEKRNQNLF